MNGKERMLTALNMGIPDRVPATVHQWQDYHLKRYMGGISDIEAFRRVGLDMAVTYIIETYPCTDTWRISSKRSRKGENTITDYLIETPNGDLSYQTTSTDVTTYVTEPMIKNDEDIYIYEKHRPITIIDKREIFDLYDEIGDGGILRSYPFGEQGSPWQEACVLYGTQEMILATYDKPDWVKEFLDIICDKKIAFLEKNFQGVPIDLLETGGGAASNTVISPALYEEFCLPVDIRISRFIHSIGHKTVYHTCGGMSKMLDLILRNECDASETLSNPEVGGDITKEKRKEVKQVLGSKICIIGGLDQHNVLGGPKDLIRDEVFSLFEDYGPNGGYIMSACDHFFNAPFENLVAYANAARECTY